MEDAFAKARPRYHRARTPTMIQMEATECGAAALGIILGYYGRFVPLEQLRLDCGVSRDGSLAINIVKSARRYGMESQGFKLDPTQLKEIKLPFIVFWQFNHFLVVEGFGRKKVFVNDPATGPRKMTYEEFEEGYTGIILTCEPGPTFEKGGKKESMHRMLTTRLKGCKAPLAFLMIIGIFLLLPGIALPTFTQIFVDQVLVRHVTNASLTILLGLLVAMLVTGILTGLQNYFLNRLNGKLSIRLSSEFLWHILRLPVEFYTQRYGGEIAYRLQLNDTVVFILTGQLVQAAINLLLVIVYGIVMFVYDPLIAGIGVAAALFNLLTMAWINRSRIDVYARYQQDLGKKIGFSIGGLQTIETLKATASESDFYGRWAGYFAKANNALKNVATYDIVLTSIPPLTQLLGASAVILIGGLRVIEGDMTIGMLLALQTLMTTFLYPITQFVYLGQNLQNLRSELSRLDDVLKNPVDKHLSTFSIHPDKKEKLKGALELKNITFGYNRLAPPLIENFNLHLLPGQSIALVGPSGCGKSTLARLITGVYQPWEGEILFDGQPSSAYTREVFSRSVASVDQQIFLFAGNIKENLTLWDETLPELHLIQAAKDAYIHEDILLREKGYDSQMLEGGRNFSGGQRQRMEIARVLALNPSLLILDEATSALDSESEEEIIKRIRQRGCACLVIAHRLSTIRDCDEIIILDRGKVIQRGPHEQLKQEQGLYQELIRMEGVIHES